MSRDQKQAKQQVEGGAFRELHAEGTFVLPNAWDAASASVIESAGPAAIATTSSGISWSLGLRDGESMTRSDVIPVIERIASAVSVPVTGDIESGYGPSPDDVAETIRAVIEAGAVGANLEDRQWIEASGTPALIAIPEQCKRIAAARQIADDSGVTFTLNVRTDVFLAGIGQADEREDMVIDRAEQYAAAGGDCLFVPGVPDIAVMKRLVNASPLPVNALVSPGPGLTINELAAAGVRRISVGGLIALAALTSAKQVTEALLSGEDRPFGSGLTHADMQELSGGNQAT
jgi:2-methylisocitrate lyase-like PEP mutase family enzyme